MYQSSAGTIKAGAVEDHAIIYTGESPPEKLDGEQSLTNSPIQVILKNNRDKLDKYSHVNYAKLYTVEHNVKVQFIGQIADTDRLRFVAAFDATWARKRTINATG